ncbi:MAG: type VII secretion protein EccE [Jatrophihabitantaceae bacterium]
MPKPTLMQFVLLELALAAVVGGLAEKRAWPAVGAGVAAVLAVLAVVPLRRRWAYQLALSWLAMMRRRQGVRGPGLQTLLGGYQVRTIAPSGHGTQFGVVRVGSMWTLPLELDCDGVCNDDAPVPVDQLAALLRVEDVPLASVRLLTVLAPARPAPHAPLGPVAPAPRVAARYCLLTLDTIAAAEAVAARGGTDAAVQQILRRCALRCEQILAAVGVRVRRLDERAVTALFASCMGPAAARPDGSLPATVESWRGIRVAGTWSVSFAVAGGGQRTPDALTQLAAGAMTPVVVTCLVLRRPGRHEQLQAMLLLRLSGPGAAPDTVALARTAEQAAAAGLVLQRLDGEHGNLLRATTPVGMGAAA